MTDGHIGKVLECFRVATDLSDAGEDFLLSSWEFNPGLSFRMYLRYFKQTFPCMYGIPTLLSNNAQ